ncbi:MAG: phosphotransferase [Chloroflexi bacterium]|nr:MAG: phosphotransferase [Chloroflexota bacterium]
MLEKPDLPDECLVACLQEAYGLRIDGVSFLPLGADFSAAVYRVVARDGRSYFVKLRRGRFDEVSVILPKLLHDQGVTQVIPPIATKTGQLWTHLDDHHLILYSFVEGGNGFEVELAPHDWSELGTALRRIHTVTLPAEIRQRIPQESYTPRWRNTLKVFLDEVEKKEYADPDAAQLAALLRAKRSELEHVIARSEALSRVVQAKALPFVLCHTDIHSWNLLLEHNGGLYIVDWDMPMLSPKERDLMFLVDGVGGIWQGTDGDAQFYEGYGGARADPVALAYYRYERGIEDIVVTAEQIFLTKEGGTDRAEGIQHLLTAFSPGGAIALAYRSDPLERRR